LQEWDRRFDPPEAIVALIEEILIEEKEARSIGPNSHALPPNLKDIPKKSGESRSLAKKPGYPRDLKSKINKNDDDRERD
jgi:hypothetical protein